MQCNIRIIELAPTPPGVDLFPQEQPRKAVYIGLIDA
jgi:hypothetical protein